MDIVAPWPNKMPKGRCIDKKNRHLTLSFLGDIPYPPLKDSLIRFPALPFVTGPAGYFDASVALPFERPRVLAWHVRFFQDDPLIADFQITLRDWLADRGYKSDEKEWLPHVTLCRRPFKIEDWKNSFSPLPFYCGGIHLYESVGSLSYNRLWTLSLPAPFEEIQHTADIAFLIRGKNIEQLFYHGFCALAFKIPSLLQLPFSAPSLCTLDDAIIRLNALISLADIKEGCALKAVSFHGEAVQISETLLQWEMIVDV